MAFEFRITATQPPGDVAKFGPLIPGRVAQPTSRDPTGGVEGLFLIDTGSSDFVIDEAVANELGLQSTRTTKAHGLGGHADVKCYSVSLFIPAVPLMMTLKPGQNAQLRLEREVGSTVGLHEANEALFGKLPGRLIGVIGRSFLRWTRTTYDGLTGTITIETDEAMRSPKDAGKESEQEEFKKQAAKLLKKTDTDVHCPDPKRSGMSTLCGKPIPPAKVSMMEKEITCEACKGQLKWLAL